MHRKSQRRVETSDAQTVESDARAGVIHVDEQVFGSLKLNKCE